MRLGVAGGVLCGVLAGMSSCGSDDATVHRSPGGAAGSGGMGSGDAAAGGRADADAGESSGGATDARASDASDSSGGATDGRASDANDSSAGASAREGGSADAGGLSCTQFDPASADDVNLDVSVVNIHGNVTLNGKALPDVLFSRGQLTFIPLPEGAPATGQVIDLKTTGPIAYAVGLTRGHYRLSFKTSESCPPRDPSGLPCDGGDVYSDLEITGDEARDIDLKVITAHGHVTVDGKPFPSGPTSYGYVSFDDPLRAGWMLVSATGDFQGHVLEGVHDVYYSGACVAGSPLPCNSGRVLRRVFVSASTPLELDLHTVHVTGSVTLDGAPLPDVAVDRGSLAVRSAAGTTPLVFFKTSGATAIDLRLLAGSYEIAIQPGADCFGFPSAMPCLSGTVVPEVTLTTDRVLDVDVRTAKVTGKVTLGGKALPPGAFGEAVWFDQAGSITTASLESSPDYSVVLLAGDHDVYFWPPRDQCGDGSGLPCTYGLVGKKVHFEGSQQYDIDLKPVTISGAVLLNGQTMPDTATARGHLQLNPGRWDYGGYDTPSFGSSGPAAYQVDVLPGVYTVKYYPETKGCGQPDPLPDVMIPLQNAIVGTQGGTVNFDVQTATMRGTLTWGRAAMNYDRIELVPPVSDPPEGYNFCPVASDTFEWTVARQKYGFYFWGSACGPSDSCLFPVGCR